MPKRKVVQTVVVHRDGQRVVPTIGQIFDFTTEELAYINELNPAAIAKIEAPVKEFTVDGGAAGAAGTDADGNGDADADADAGDKSTSTAVATTGRAGRTGRQAAAADGDI